MALASFHPALSSWFSRALGTPTEPQALAWPSIAAGRDTLIAAPTGSGKTLAAFFAVLDGLVKRGPSVAQEGTQVVYVSPLKALSNDIQKNLDVPLAGVRNELGRLGYEDVAIRAAVRTGDTSPSARQRLAKEPPHILVTTPESLYLLLTSESGQRMLATTRTVIVDEIHALAPSKRGAHLALSLERLQALAAAPLLRIGLSATQRPIDDVARFLVGGARLGADGTPRCDIVDVGHRRAMDLALELPGSPLEAVASNELWAEVFHKLTSLIEAHTTTLVFVQTRRMAERLTHALGERLGEEAVASHHGSLSAERRHVAEQRLKAGQLRALVATASLELGIDIGAVDLVCQIGTPRSIATFLQRVGRSGHNLRGTPKGRLFPLTRDELIEGTALLAAVARGDLDRSILPRAPLDILAQQIVATAADSDISEDDLYALVRRSYSYHDLPRADFDAVVAMLADGFSTKRGRRAAHVHRDVVRRRIRGKRGARLVALTSGGAIPDNADYQVVLEPSGTFIGTLNEDFAIESSAGDIFLLGNTSWRILKVENGRVRVEDAHGQPPTIPFWIGEAPARTRELSEAVGSLRSEAQALLVGPGALSERLTQVPGVPAAAATQISDYLASANQVLGALPSHARVIAERFFDASGGMQLVLHAPFGGRINRAWGLALRKRFCRTFNFELQAAATEDAIVLSLGAQHSFPLADVFSFLSPRTVHDVLVQALLDAPMFQTRWRWNASRSLALLRRRGGKPIPANIQRMEAEDLVAAVFPDQLACLENIVGERQIPNHPLVTQTIHDCLHEAMDLDGLIEVLTRIERGEIECLARDLPEPSPLAHEILAARPYAFLDGAPLEERRTRAVLVRRGSAPAHERELGALDASAIERVRTEVFPRPRDADEAYDALVELGVLSAAEHDMGDSAWRELVARLSAQGRATRVDIAGEVRYVAIERLAEVRQLHPGAEETPPLLLEGTLQKPGLEQDVALKELVRSRLECSGPVTANTLARLFGVSAGDLEVVLFSLEAEGFVLRGSYTPGAREVEWCERRVLARIHRLTVQRLRAEIEPVALVDYMRFLTRWQRLSAHERARGQSGLDGVLALLDGFEAPAAAWEADILAPRVADYDASWLDQACLSGRLMWARLRAQRTDAGLPPSAMLRTSPITLFAREHMDHFLALATREAHDLTNSAELVRLTLNTRGASFFAELCKHTGLAPFEVERALVELVAFGLVSSDGFAAVRSLLVPEPQRPSVWPREERTRNPFAVAGRFSLVQPLEERASDEAALTCYTRALLKRYGVVFRAVLGREALGVPWRDILHVCRRLEARGDLRGGHFIDGPSGEQFALPEAVALLRSTRREPKHGELVTLGAVDPLNLVGVALPGPRIPAIAGNRLLLQDGEPVAALVSGEVIHIGAPRLSDEDARRGLSRLGASTHATSRAARDVS